MLWKFKSGLSPRFPFLEYFSSLRVQAFLNTRNYMKIAILALGLITAHAAETTVELKPFKVERSFPATLLPAEPILISIEPKAFGDFTIEKILPHGSAVKKGDVLVKFDSKSIDRKLEDARQALDAQKLALASRELAFSKLEEETEMKLTAARRAARNAADDLKYFNEFGRSAREDSAKDDLEGARQRLAGAQEELKQLKKMYDADDVTEETEEIILTRQEYTVKAAELRLRLTELSTTRELETDIPRMAEAQVTADRTASIALEKAEKDLPRALEAAKIELDGAKTALERGLADLEDLEADKKLMSLTAPANGTFFHGSLDEGRWTLGDLAKALVKGGKVPFIRPFASIVPETPALGLVAHVDEATARSLSTNLKGSATAAGREDLPLTATINSIPLIPGRDGSYRIDLSPAPATESTTLPAISTGMDLECRFIVYQNASAVAVPVKALHATAEGTWAVDLKLTDGKTESRPITRGRVSGDQVEILSGLEAGQVIITKD